jgi:crotonobetainyl-CoA:carnitine CoA-transferase CaiB-like acyl-CoA transferase
MPPTHVLDGIKVLDFTQFLAGPTASRVLAELGAEVVKIEWGPAGDFSRNFPHIQEGRGAFYVQHNRGKKSVCMDLRKPEAIELLKRLLPEMDVLIENYSPGVIGRLGLGWDVVHALNPRLIMCSMSAFGQQGELSGRPGYDQVAQAFSGFTSLVGDPDGPPSIVAMSIGDVGTGMNAACAINAALFHRERTGRGQYLDVSLLDTYHNFNDSPMEMVSGSKGAYKPWRTGSHHHLICPTGFFKSAEGYVCLLAVTPAQWAGLCHAMGRAEWVDAPGFRDNAERLQNLDTVVGAIEGWMQSLPSDDAVCKALEEHRVPYAPVLTIQQAMEHPHGWGQKMVRNIADPVLGELTIPGPPFRFSEFPDGVEVQAPLLGQHNLDVLGRYCGLSAQDVARLEADGILASARR